VKPITLRPRKFTLRVPVAARRLLAPRPYHVIRAEIENNPRALASLQVEGLRRLKTVGLILVQASLCLGAAYLIAHQLAASGVLS